MRQALHIFRKDLRGLRGEVGLLLTVAAFLGWAETRLFDATWVEAIAAVVANYAIARVIHYEAIPGDNQFWVTRPYRWQSLLTAKALFVLLCVQLPILLAQGYMIVAGQFSFLESLPGLLCSQLLMLVCVVLPIACLASLTSGMVSFVFTELILVAAGFIGGEVMHAPAGPDAMRWVRDSLAGVVIAGIAAVVLFRQYRGRRTNRNRMCGGVGIAAACAIFLLIPWRVALGVQSTLSRQKFDASALSPALKSIQESVFPIRGRDETGPTEVNLPISVRGIPSDMEAAADALVVQLSGADGKTWSSDLVPVFVRPGEPGAALINMGVVVEPLFFRDESTRPVTVHATLYLTLFGNRKSMTIPIRQQPVNVMDGLQCAEGVFIQFTCRSIFRWPRRRVSVATNSNGSESPVSSISYSPFPAELGFGAVEQHSFPVPYAASEATITTREPLSHFRADLTIPNVILARFTKEAKHQFNRGMTGTE